MCILFNFGSRYESKPLQLPGVLRPGGNKVDAGGFDAGMPQHIRQFYYIPAGPVESPGKEVPQIVGKHLAFLHPGPATQRFHLRPYLSPAQPPTASGEEYLPGGDLLFSGIF